MTNRLSKFIKILFKKKKKLNKFANLILVFTDSNGMNYYMYRDNMLLALTRLNKLLQFQEELGNSMTGENIDMFINGLKAAINKPKPDIAMAGHIINEMSNRRKDLIREDIVLKLFATIYIREDEIPEDWNENIFREKLIQFKLDAYKSGDTYDWFKKKGIMQFYPSYEKLEGNLEKYMEEVKVKMAAIRKQIEDYTIVQ